jgi:hypothetical protein
MARSAVVLSFAAAVVALTDLAHKAVVLGGGEATLVVHPRSAGYAVGVVLVSAVWAWAILLTRSVSIALAGGVYIGGAVGNVASLVLWPGVDGIPDPLVAGRLAFNLADVAIALGLVVVLGSAAVFAARNRGRLGEPVRL